MDTTNTLGSLRPEATVVDLETLSSVQATQARKDAADNQSISNGHSSKHGPSKQTSDMDVEHLGIGSAPVGPPTFFGPSLPGTDQSTFSGPSLPGEGRSAFFGPSLPGVEQAPTFGPSLPGVERPATFGPSLPGAEPPINSGPVLGPFLPGPSREGQGSGSMPMAYGGKSRSADHSVPGPTIDGDSIVSAFQSMEDYEDKMQGDFHGGNSLIRLFYEDSGERSFGAPIYKGVSGHYAKPVPLGCNLMTSLESNQESLKDVHLCYVIVCLIVGQDAESFDSIEFDFQRVDVGAFAAGGKKFIRVLLRRQTTPNIQVQVNHKRGFKPGLVQLCYVDICQIAPDNSSYDCILPPIPRLRRSFNVWHTDTEDVNGKRVPSAVEWFEVSESGSHVATLSWTGSRLHLDLWDLNLNDTDLTKTYPSLPTDSIAHIVVNHGSEYYKRIKLSVSWDGSQIAVYGSEYTNGSPVQLFTKSDSGSVGKQQSKRKPAPATLLPSDHPSQCEKLQSFVGHAKFTVFSQSEDNPGNVAERFITTDGQNVYVYSITGPWMQIHSLPVLPEQDLRTSSLMLNTSAKGVIVSEISFYRLCIWNLETGIRQHIINTTHKIWKHILSTDGQILAIVTTGTLLLYSTSSGELIQRSMIPSNIVQILVQGNPNVYGWQDGLPRRVLLMKSTEGLPLNKKYTIPLYDVSSSVRDVNFGLDGFPVKSSIVGWEHGSILEIGPLEDLFISIDGQPLCTPGCATDLHELSVIETEKVITYSWGKCTITTREGLRRPISIIDIQFNDGRSKQYWWEVSSLHMVDGHPQAVTVDQEFQDRRCSIWMLPQSFEEDIELLLCWSLESDAIEHSIYACPHDRTLTFRSGRKSTHLDPEQVFTLENAEKLFKATSGYFTRDEDCREVFDAEARFFRSYINRFPSPGDHSKSILTRGCLEWRGMHHERFKAALNCLLYSDSEHGWVPLRTYSKGANPVGVMLDHAKKSPEAMEVVRAMIDYCFSKVKTTKDIIYTHVLIECIDELSARYEDIALRTTRGLAYVKHHNRELIVNNHKITHPPTVRRFWAPDTRKIYECKNPILQLHYIGEQGDPLNANFTEEIYVTPVNLLWSFVPNTKKPCKEFTDFDPKVRVTWLSVLFHSVLLNLNPFKHSYIKPRYHSLDTLDNPAAEAVIQYKWNKYVFAVWLARFLTQCIYYTLIVIAALMQVYYDNPNALLGVFFAIISFSCLFLWLEFLQWQEDRFDDDDGDSAFPNGGLGNQRTKGSGTPATEAPQTGYFAQLVRCIFRPFAMVLGMSANEGQNQHAPRKERSPYFRSPYNLLDLVMYLYPLGTSIHQCIDILNGTDNGWTADFSFCLVFVFLHLLAELRVSENMCKYITIVFGVLREIRLFFLVFAAGVLFFSIAIVHILFGISIQGVENSNRLEGVNLPKHFFGAITTVYLMIGGRYDPLADDLFANSEGEKGAEYKNWPLIVMVMVYFTFSSILMLNVLIALINVAFVKADDSWWQVYLENRLRYVESAENMSYYIPGLREAFDWFPSEIYYTATQYQERQYTRRIKKKDEEILLEDSEDPVPEKASTDEVAKTLLNSSLLASRIAEIEEKIGRQGQDQQQSLLVIKEHLVKQSQDGDHQSGVSGIRSQLEQGSREQAVRAAELHRVAERSQSDISGMRSDNSELRREVIGLKRDIQAILDAIQILQAQLSQRQ